MQRRWARAELIGVGALMVAAMVWSAVGRPVSLPRPAPGFTLIDQYGRPFSFAQLRGKVVAIFFGYTHCPDVCPTTLSLFAEAARQLQGTAAAEAVQFVFVSVDPERDTPERLREYVQLFGAPVVALTGSPEQVQPVLAAWGVVAEKVTRSDDPGAYEMVHTASVLLVDQSGRIRAQLPFGSPVEELVGKIRELLGSYSAGRGARR